MVRFEWKGKFFEWDPNKAESNIRDHGITFDEAKEVFEDPLAVFKLERIVNGEERWQIVGMCQRYLLLLVVHTSRETDDKELVRIISARELETWERKEFEYGTRN